MSRRRIVKSLAVLVVLGAAAPQAWAWYHLRAAKSALKRHDPDAARKSAAACLRVWSERPGVHLLASRAARQAGEFDAADAELRAAQRLNGGASDEIAFEWALLQAAAGNVQEVEEYLQAKAELSPAAGPLVWEALAEGYLRLYRTLDAMKCLDHWLGREPDSARALELRGITFVTGNGAHRGAEDFRRAVALDPRRTTARWRLCLCLLDLGGYTEALPHLEQLAREKPGDVDVSVRLARCLQMLGRPADAVRILDGVLAANPENGLAMRTRGQFALSANPPQLGEAERWLARAAAALPNDYQSQWFYAEVLRLQGKDADARAQVKRAEDVKDRAERVNELRSRKLAEQPLDPSLHVEMASHLVRTGQAALAERWLVSALSLDPNYRPAHEALAAYYESVGDKAKAETHRNALK